MKLVLVGCSLLLCNCASIISGKTQKVSIESAPAGASVVINGENAGVTPLKKDLSRKTSHRVEVNLPGHQPYVTTVEQSVNGWFFGNVALGGLIGMVVDGATGAMYKLSPGKVEAVMVPNAAGTRRR